MDKVFANKDYVYFLEQGEDSKWTIFGMAKQHYRERLNVKDYAFTLKSAHRYESYADALGALASWAIRRGWELEVS